MRQSMLPITVRMAVGLTGAIASGRFLQFLMEAVEPLGIGACVLRVAPMRALRAE